MKALILFDFDGTLVDSIDDMIASLNQAAVEHGYAEAASREVMRNSSTQEMRKLFGVPFWKVPFLIPEWRKLYTDRAPRIKLFQGIKDILETFKHDAYLSVVTSNDGDFARSVLQKEKVDAYFDEIIGGSFFGKNKDIKKLMKKHKIPAKNVLYVGDETRDVHAARRARVASLSVTWGMQSPEVLMKARPSMLAQTPSEAKQLIQAWLESRL